MDDPTEIAEMVRRFYADVAKDDILGPMFNDVAVCRLGRALAEADRVLVPGAALDSRVQGNPYRGRGRCMTGRFSSGSMTFPSASVICWGDWAVPLQRA